MAVIIIKMTTGTTIEEEAEVVEVEVVDIKVVVEGVEEVAEVEVEEVNSITIKEIMVMRMYVDFCGS